MIIGQYNNEIKAKCYQIIDTKCDKYYLWV